MGRDDQWVNSPSLCLNCPLYCPCLVSCVSLCPCSRCQRTTSWKISKVKYMSYNPKKKLAVGSTCSPTPRARTERDTTDKMPFRYKPKEGATRRHKFSEQTLRNALDDIGKGMSIRKAAIKYDINRTTLRRYMTDENKLKIIETKGSQYKGSQIFTLQEEKSLVDYLLTCSKMNYGLTRTTAMKIACEYAQANAKKLPESWLQNNSAGRDWFRGFLKRNTEISMRTPEATSLSRATSFNRKNVGDFFENLKQVREKFQFEPQNIYNCDETGCTTVHKCPKVIASKQARQVGQMTSADRGTLVTVCFAVNAIGNVIPPFFIFPRVKYNESFVANGPEGSDGDAYSSGWMTVKSFLKFMKHFVKYSRASKENPTLLIFDNHESHVSVEGINFAKENGVTLLTIPPHCSNNLQPLDIAVYSSFKTRYNTAMSNWMLSNPGKTVTIYNIPAFVKDVMSQAFSQANIVSGFRNSGIHPFNPAIFDDENFLCSAVTDREMTVGQGSSVPSPVSPSILGMVTKTAEANRDTSASSLPTTSIAEGQVPARSPIPSTSTAEGQDAPKSVITPEMIKAYPKAAPRKSTRRGRQPGKTKILTKTPEKNDQDPEAQEPKQKKRKKTQKINKSKKQAIKRKILPSSDSETEV